MESYVSLVAAALVLLTLLFNLNVTRSFSESRKEHEQRVERLLTEIRDKLLED